MVSLLDVYSARRRVSPYVRRTPLERSGLLGDLTGGEVWLKLENRQLTGSFKLRGAANRMLLLTPEERRRGVVAASAGNHGQGVGYMARELGVGATVYVPESTPDVKRDAMKKLDVELVISGAEYDDAERAAIEAARRDGAVYLSPYNDEALIAGQATLALEMLEDKPDIDTVLVPVGGGGLASGVATVWKSVGARVLGVQSEASPVMHESLRRGRIVSTPMSESIAEGLSGGIEAGSVTFELCRRLLDGIILVREESIRSAIRLMLLRHREVLEGSGAVGVAALMEDPGMYRGRRVGVVLSGGNLDEKEILRILS